jgi:hypothetical protein
MNQAEVVVSGLDRVAFLDLRKIVGEENLVLPSGEKSSNDIHGELIMITSGVLILVTPAAIKLLAKWLMKHRKLQIKISRKDKDGSEESFSLNYSSGSKKEEKPGLLDRITEALTKEIFGNEPAS